MGKYDLPAQVEYALATNGAEKLVYVGHSQGTMQAFIAFSGIYNPEIINKVSLFIALAPVAYVGHVCKQISVTLSFFIYLINHLIISQPSSYSDGRSSPRLRIPSLGT